MTDKIKPAPQPEQTREAEIVALHDRVALLSDELSDMDRAARCDMDSMRQALEALEVAQTVLRERLGEADMRPVIEQAEGGHIGIGDGTLMLDGQYPHSKDWQGLTRQEFLDATQGLEDLEDCWMAIEAKLKEKNNVLR